MNNASRAPACLYWLKGFLHDKDDDDDDDQKVNILSNSLIKNENLRSETWVENFMLLVQKVRNKPRKKKKHGFKDIRLPAAITEGHDVKKIGPNPAIFRDLGGARPAKT